jgi:hypothetical protein
MIATLLTTARQLRLTGVALKPGAAILPAS